MITRRMIAFAGAAACAVAAIALSTTNAASSPKVRISAPLPAADSPEQVFNRISNAMATGELHHTWDCLPESWQRDATSLVHDFAATVDPEVWNRSFVIVRKVGVLMREQKDLILSMPNFRNDPNFDYAEASEAWDRIANLMFTIADSDLADARKMRNIDIRSFLGTTGGAFFTEMQAINKIAPNVDANPLEVFTNSRASLVRTQGNTAVISIASPGQPARQIDMVRIEGKWIPADFAREWPGQMAEARDALATMSGDDFQQIKPQVMQLLTGLEMTLDQLAMAETQAQFEQTAQMGMMQIFGAVMAISSAQQD